MPFLLGKTAVTNAEFSAFISDTQFVTDAERFGWSFVFYQFLNPSIVTTGARGAEWWRKIEGACWCKPDGPGSTIDGKEDLPVVHVSWNDATAFAKWAGGRLPTEAEWEHAARGGLQGEPYPRGSEDPNETEFLPCNIWQGTFPDHNTAADGYYGLAPAMSFAPNGYGLFNMCGNCWEWTADEFRVRSLRRDAKKRSENAKRIGEKVLKGGSYLCHESYCHRYRIPARIGNTPDSSTGHMGFRIAFDPMTATKDEFSDHQKGSTELPTRQKSCRCRHRQLLGDVREDV